MVKSRPLPPAEELRAAFLYEPETGILRFRVRPHAKSAVRAGDQAGSARANGYMQVTLRGRNMLVHRVIWKIQTGEDPSAWIDHENRDRSDNRWVNLREASPKDNQGNRHSAGRYLPGTWKKHNRWQANTPGAYLGMYDSEEEAHQAYRAWHVSRFGSFSIYAS